MHHPVDRLIAKQALHPGPIGEIEPVKRKTRLRLQSGQPGLLEGDLVVVIEVVQPDDRLAARQQALGQMKTDETGRAGDQNRHVQIPW
jgi:hypothetical protein